MVDISMLIGVPPGGLRSLGSFCKKFPTIARPASDSNPTTRYINYRLEISRIRYTKQPLSGDGWQGTRMRHGQRTFIQDKAFERIRHRKLRQTVAEYFLTMLNTSFAATGGILRRGIILPLQALASATRAASGLSPLDTLATLATLALIVTLRAFSDERKKGSLFGVTPGCSARFSWTPPV